LIASNGWRLLFQNARTRGPLAFPGARSLEEFKTVIIAHLRTFSVTKEWGFKIIETTR
jgi:hypothetical protein